MIADELGSLIDNVQNVRNSSPSEETEKDSKRDSHPNIHKTNVQNQGNGKGTLPQNIFKTKLPPPPSVRPKIKSSSPQPDAPETILKTNATPITIHSSQQNEEKIKETQENKCMTELLI